MAHYFTGKSQEAFEKICKEGGREVPALALLWGFKDAGLKEGETLIAFFNAFGGTLVSAQTIDDMSDVDRVLGFDIGSRFYFVKREIIDNHPQ